MDTSAWFEMRAEIPSPAVGRFAGSRLEVLVVDDDVDGAESLAQLLGIHGYKVRVAFDGIQALREIEVAQPDVILLDIGLPKMDGFGVARWLRNQVSHRTPFIIAITGYGQEEHLRHSEEVGIDLHLVKPVPFEVLRTLLTRLEVSSCRQGEQVSRPAQSSPRAQDSDEEGHAVDGDNRSTK